MTTRSITSPNQSLGVTARDSWLRFFAGQRGRALILALTSSVASLFPIQGKAADGCLMLLCLAAPSWQNVAQCADPVREVLRDLARGRPFPTCPMAGTGNIAENQWTNPPYFCPPQYTHSFEAPDNTVYDCDYVGAVTVSVNGSVWSRTWWSTSGREAVTEFTPVAKAQLGSWNTRFDDDYAAWLASLPPIVGCTTC